MIEHLNTPQKRLKYFINQNFNSRIEFCNKIGMRNDTLTKYINESNNIIGKKYRDRLINLGLNYNWYMFGKGGMLLKNSEYQTTNKYSIVVEPNVSELYNINIDELQEFAEIPLYLVSAQAITTNTFVSFDDLPVFKTNVGFGLKVNPKTTKAIFVTGDSLSEARIYSGETVVFDIVQEPKNNDLVICNLNGNLIIKKYEFKDGIIYLHSAYNGIKPIIINHIDDKFKILGIVIGVYRQIRKGLA